MGRVIEEGLEPIATRPPAGRAHDHVTRLVPLTDLSHVNRPLHADILAAIAGVMETGRFLNGPVVEAFEGEFAAYCRTENCVGMSSGLDALRLTLLAAGLETGDEVLVPAQTLRRHMGGGHAGRRRCRARRHLR